MIAKYNGKCDLTGTAIVAGQTEIAKFGHATVLAEYASQEAVDAWFASKVAEFESLARQIAEVTGSQTFVSNTTTEFNESLARRRASRFSILKSDADWVRSEIARMERTLKAKRNRSH